MNAKTVASAVGAAAAPSPSPTLRSSNTPESTTAGTLKRNE